RPMSNPQAHLSGHSKIKLWDTLHDLLPLRRSSPPLSDARWAQAAYSPPARTIAWNRVAVQGGVKGRRTAFDHVLRGSGRRTRTTEWASGQRARGYIRVLGT